MLILIIPKGTHPESTISKLILFLKLSLIFHELFEYSFLRPLDQHSQKLRESKFSSLWAQPMYFKFDIPYFKKKNWNK